MSEGTLQQCEKICVMYSWVLCEWLMRDIRWGITVGSFMGEEWGEKKGLHSRGHIIKDK